MKNLLMITFIFVLSVSSLAGSMQEISIFDVFHNIQEFLKYQLAYTSEDKLELDQLITAGQGRWGFEIDLKKNEICVFDNINYVIGVDGEPVNSFTWKNKELVDLVMSFFDQRIEKTKLELVTLKVNYVDIIEEEVHTISGTDIIENLLINYSIRLVNPLNKKIIVVNDMNYIECL